MFKLYNLCIDIWFFTFFQFVYDMNWVMNGNVMRWTIQMWNQINKQMMNIVNCDTFDDSIRLNFIMEKVEKLFCWNCYWFCWWIMNIEHLCTLHTAHWIYIEYTHWSESRSKEIILIIKSIKNHYRTDWLTLKGIHWIVENNVFFYFFFISLFVSSLILSSVFVCNIYLCLIWYNAVFSNLFSFWIISIRLTPKAFIFISNK